MSDVSASNSSSMSLRAPSRTSVLVRSSASVPCLAPIANCSANCPSCSARGILVIGLGLLGVSLSGFSPTTDGSPDHSLFTDRLSHHRAQRAGTQFTPLAGTRPDVAMEQRAGGRLHQQVETAETADVWA